MTYTILLILLFCGLVISKQKKTYFYISTIYIMIIGSLRSISVGTDVQLYETNFYYTNFNFGMFLHEKNVKSEPGSD